MMILASFVMQMSNPFVFQGMGNTVLGHVGFNLNPYGLFVLFSIHVDWVRLDEF